MTDRAPLPVETMKDAVGPAVRHYRANALVGSCAQIDPDGMSRTAEMIENLAGYVDDWHGAYVKAKRFGVIAVTIAFCAGVVVGSLL